MRSRRLLLKFCSLKPGEARREGTRGRFLTLSPFAATFLGRDELGDVIYGGFDKRWHGGSKRCGGAMR